MGLLTTLLGSLDGAGVEALGPLGGKVDAGDRLYTVPGVAVSGVSTQTCTADRVYYEPMVLSTETTFDRIAIEVTTAAAGLALLGVYGADDEWQPDALEFEIGAALDVSTTGLKASTISQTLSPGRYLRTITSNIGIVNRCLRGNGIGVDPTAGAANMVPFQAYKARTYAALPATGVKWDTTSLFNVGFNHTIFLRAA